MTETEFLQVAEDTIFAIENALDECEVDIDFDMMSEVLTLVFENKSQVIINKQTPLKQIWVAAKSGGFHFDYNDDKQDWVLNSDSERTLNECLNEYCTAQAGQTVQLVL